MSKFRKLKRMHRRYAAAFRAAGYSRHAARRLGRWRYRRLH